jgi:integrase
MGPNFVYLLDAKLRHHFMPPNSYGFTPPVTLLRRKRPDVEPFTFGEVRMIIETVRPDFKSYFTTRFFTGMRTGEVHGLKWKYVDFDRRLILIRETVVDGEETYTKTDSSPREIEMSQLVFDALKKQKESTGKLSEFVFVTGGVYP